MANSTLRWRSLKRENIHFQPVTVYPPYDGSEVINDPKNKRPCEWHYVFDERDDGCWTFDAWVVPGSAGPDVECGDCQWQLVYCEKEAAGNTKGNDYMILNTNSYYKDGTMMGLCGNYDGNAENDNTDAVCADAEEFANGNTITEKCIDGDHQGNGN